MKPLKIMMGVAAATMLMVAGSSKIEAQKVLVLYYSQTSNTKAVAQEIATKLNADIEEIALVNPYSAGYQSTIERSRKEREQGITPEIKPLKVDIAKYDVIFLGYPIWFGTYAPPIITWLNKVDLSGKTIVPFCTFGSGGLESSVKDLTAIQPKAKILDGYGVRAARMAAMPAEVDQFLKAGRFIEGPYTKLPEFSSQHALSDAEKSIFNGAVGNYPMIKAEALSVATRPIPYGIEYLYIAKSLPRADFPDMPLTEMKIYVTVANGEMPVFTKVIR